MNRASVRSNTLQFSGGLISANENAFPISSPMVMLDMSFNMLPAMVGYQSRSANSSAPLEHSKGEAAALSLRHKKIAVLVTDGFEQEELLGPKGALEAEGAVVEIISDKPSEVQGFKHTQMGDAIPVDCTFDAARFEEYDAVLLPGGVINGDAMRMFPAAREFVKFADQRAKPIAAICHGGWLLISAGIANRRTVTSWPSLQDDFRNAGSHWLDQEVVRDKNFISSRKPADIPAFNSALISLLRER